MTFGGACTIPQEKGKMLHRIRRFECTESSEARAVLRVVEDFAELQCFHMQSRYFNEAEQETGLIVCQPRQDIPSASVRGWAGCNKAMTQTRCGA